MEHVQTGRTRTDSFGRFRNHIVLTALCLFAPFAQAETRIIKDLNAQLGKTMDQIAVQPVFGTSWFNGRVNAMGEPVQASACEPVKLKSGYEGWHACRVKVLGILFWNMGVAPSISTSTTGTVTGGPRVIPTTNYPNTPGNPFPVEAPIIIHDDPIQINTQTNTIENPGSPGGILTMDLLLYFFFPDESWFVDGSDRAVSWQARRRVREISRDKWDDLGGRGLDGNGKPARFNDQKKLWKIQDAGWWHFK